VGGCVSVKDRFVGIAERTPGLNPDPGRSVEPRLGDSTVPLLACGLREVSLKEAGFDLDSFWKNSQIVALQEQLERRGAKVVLGAVRLFASPSVKLGFVPFSPEGGIAFEERAGQLNAVALLKQANGTLNVFPDGREELWTLLSASEVENLVATLKKDRAFASFFQGKQIHIAQSVGVQTASKGLLYLAAARDLASRAVMEYYRVQVSRSNNGSQMVPGTLRALCGSGNVQILGAPAGMIMNTVGVYSDSEELVSKNPCMLGLGALACMDMRSWVLKVSQEKTEQSNMTTLDFFNWALQQQGVEGGVLYVQDLESPTKLLLTGFRGLLPEQIRSLLNAAKFMDRGLQLRAGLTLPQPDPTSGLCPEQQPIPSEWIELARQFLQSNPDWSPTLESWARASVNIGRLGLGQETFNLYVAALVLAVKLGVENPSLWGLTPAGAQQRANQILQFKLKYALDQIAAGTKDKAAAWMDKVIVAGRTLLGQGGNDSNWILLDFLRTLDQSGNEVPWTDSNPPGHYYMIDVVAWRPFGGSSNGTLLAFIKVDSSTWDSKQGRFHNPLDPSNNRNVSEMAYQILVWLNGVYNHIIQGVVPGAAFYWHGMKVVGWIFTKPQDPAAMRQLITEIQNQALKRLPNGFQYPFFIAYVADGQHTVVCFGCQNQQEIMAVWLAACQLGGICAARVEVVGSSKGQQTSDNMVFPTPGDPHDVGGIVSSTGSIFFDMADGGGGDFDFCSSKQ
jgi:hypothetical protein